MFLETRKKFEVKYNMLKENIIEITDYSSPEEYKQKIDLLKHLFGKQIRSVRQLDAAEHVATLINLLEKRLFLGWFNVDLFVEILEVFEIDGSTRDEFLDYREELSTYRLKNKKAFTFPPYDPEVFCDVPLNREVIPTNISNYICQKMGDDWRYFGRELISEGLTVEGFVDKLAQDPHLSPAQITQKLLDALVNGDKRSKISQLSKILKAIQRYDLDDELEKMLLEHCGL